MVRMMGGDEVVARSALAAVGVRIHEVRPGEIVAGVPDHPDVGMTAWHVNDVDELHVVTSGQGIMEFVPLVGVVPVIVEAGDVVEIRGTEHRYRSLIPQGWRLRFSAGPDEDLVATETGRDPGLWPIPR